jgi:hypothetical protein
MGRDKFSVKLKTYEPEHSGQYLSVCMVKSISMEKGRHKVCPYKTLFFLITNHIIWGRICRGRPCVCPFKENIIVLLFKFLRITRSRRIIFIV